MTDKPFEWEPWTTYKKDRDVLPIIEPPCKHCVHWNPQRDFSRNGKFNGIKCCTSDNIFDDFSCFCNREV